MVVQILRPFLRAAWYSRLCCVQTPRQFLSFQGMHQARSSLLTENVFVQTVLVSNGFPRAVFSHLPPSVVCLASLYQPSVIPARHKSRKKQNNSDDESDSDMDDNLDEDDFEAPPQFKVFTIHAPSLRTDAVISNSLSISRHRLEELFLASCLLLNGTKMNKKGIKMDEGDYVDVIIEKLEEEIKVKRVKLLKINPQKTGTDKFSLKVRVWKSPFFLEHTRTRERP